MSDQTPGWHSDPTSRHQYRFWNGTVWTDQVSDNGMASSDPLQGPPQPAAQPAAAPPAWGPGPGTPPAAAPGWGAAPGPGGFPPGPPSPGAKKGNGPKLVAAGIVALLVIAAVVVLVGRDDDGGADGSGTFAYSVADDAPTVHTLEVGPGAAVCGRVEGRDADKIEMSYGVDGASYDRLRENDYLGDEEYAQQAAANFYSDLDTDFTDGLNTDEVVQDYPGFTGAVLFPVYLDSDDRSFCQIWPVGGTVSLLLKSTDGTADIELVVQTKDNPDVDGDLTTDAFTDLDTDFYTDFEDSFSS